MAQAKGIPARQAAQEVQRVMQEAGIGSMSGRLDPPSGPRATGSAWALRGRCWAPAVYHFDEPTVGWTPLQIIEIRDLIRQLGKKHTVI